jgi:putative phosphoribosyl transferase
VLALNRRTLGQLRGRRDLVVVPSATHLFGEPGALESVAQHARDWFAVHLEGDGPPSGIRRAAPIA